MTPQVSIIILNWNGKADTIECLQSLRQLRYSCYEILVVDNGSTDDSVRCIQQQFPDVALIQNDENLGFVDGNNQGIQYALDSGSAYILLLNNDTVVEPSFLSTLVAVGERYRDIGMLNPVISCYDTESLWFCAGAINWSNGVTSHFTELSQTRRLAENQEIILTDYATGCALLVKSELIRTIGLLDSRFFAYYEDVDWSIRCQKAGWKTVVVPAATIRHKVSATAPPSQAFIWGHRNLILFLWKHSAIWQFPFRFRRAAYKCLHEFTWHTDKALGEAAMHGLWSAVTFRFGKEHRKMPARLLRFIDRHIKYFLTLCGETSITMIRLLRFGKRYFLSLGLCVYLHLFGVAFKRNRELLHRICLHFGVEKPPPPAPQIPAIIPGIAIENIVSEHIEVEILHPQAMDGNVSCLELVTIDKLVKSLKPKTCFEFGTFNGRTTLNLAANTLPECRIYTLDLPQSEGAFTEGLPLENGDKKFIAHRKVGELFRATPHESKIQQLFGDSASFDFHLYENQMDFVFVDGAHSYDYVKQDTLTALRLLRNGKGAIVWHDYDSVYWQGLTKALHEFYQHDVHFQNIHHIEYTTLCILKRL